MAQWQKVLDRVLSGKGYQVKQMRALLQAYHLTTVE